MRISDWSSDVCSSDLGHQGQQRCQVKRRALAAYAPRLARVGRLQRRDTLASPLLLVEAEVDRTLQGGADDLVVVQQQRPQRVDAPPDEPEQTGSDETRRHDPQQVDQAERSEERRVGKECGSTWRSRWSTYH